MFLAVSHPDEEEGEAEPVTVKYKPEKLVCFPGFNEHAPRGVKDVSALHNIQLEMFGINNRCDLYFSFGKDIHYSVKSSSKHQLEIKVI